MMRSAILLAAGLTVAVLAQPILQQSAWAQQPLLLGPNLAPQPAAAIAPVPQDILPAQPRGPVDERIAFNAAEGWLIPHYFEQVRQKQKRASRSKKYPRALPDGIAADPAKGDLLPLGVLARIDRLPGPLQRELPPNRPGTDRVIVGKNVLMVNRVTGEVLDILPNVLY
jgi:hypothetical protein